MTDYTKLIERLREGQTHDFATGDLLDQSVVMDEAADAIEALQSKLGDAIRSSAHWQHQCTELQARVDAMGKGEAVCEVVREDTTYIKWNDKANHLPVGTKLYAEPKALAPLTDEQIKQALRLGNQNPSGLAFRITRAIEAAHGIHAKGGQHEDA